MVEQGGREERGVVAQLLRYPVKSMRGEELASARLGERGVTGDRGWAVRDTETGKVASAKLPRRWSALLTCRAALLDQGDSGGETAITLPDGRRVIAGSGEAEAALSVLLDRPVRLTADPPAEATIERYWPDMEGLDLRDTVTANELAAAAPGTFFDFAPIHLLTAASLARLRALLPESQIPVGRFRPNLVIETGDAPGWVENAWAGRVLLIGRDVRLRILTPTPRCVVPTLEQPGVARDLDILRAIAAHNRPPIPILGGRTQASLGVYALVERPGVIERGDRVRVAPGA